MSPEIYKALSTPVYSGNLLVNSNFSIWETYGVTDNITPPSTFSQMICDGWYINAGTLVDTSFSNTPANGLQYDPENPQRGSRLLVERNSDNLSIRQTIPFEKRFFGKVFYLSYKLTDTSPAGATGNVSLRPELNLRVEVPPYGMVSANLFKATVGNVMSNDEVSEKTKNFYYRVELDTLEDLGDFFEDANFDYPVGHPNAPIMILSLVKESTVDNSFALSEVMLVEPDEYNIDPPYFPIERDIPLSYTPLPYHMEIESLKLLHKKVDYQTNTVIATGNSDTEFKDNFIRFDSPFLHDPHIRTQVTINDKIESNILEQEIVPLKSGVNIRLKGANATLEGTGVFVDNAPKPF